MSGGGLRAAVDRLEPRERRMLALLGAFAGVFALVMVGWGVGAALDARRGEIDALERAIRDVKAGRDQVRARQARREAVLSRYAIKAPPLGAMIEKAAKEQKLEVPESQDRPEATPHGKKFLERFTAVRFRKATMLQIAKTLESIEQSRTPVVVSRLGIRRRPGEHDSYDVDLGVSAYDRAEAPKDVGKESGAKDGGAPSIVEGGAK